MLDRVVVLCSLLVLRVCPFVFQYIKYNALLEQLLLDLFANLVPLCLGHSNGFISYPFV